MIVVFWRETDPTDEWIRSEMVEFQPNEMSEALKFMEALRKMRREGTKKLSHVCMQSELVEVVGEAGVSDAPKDYAWFKRRLDPAVKVGRNSGDDIEVEFE